MAKRTPGHDDDEGDDNDDDDDEGDDDEDDDDEAGGTNGGSGSGAGPVVTPSGSSKWTSGSFSLEWRVSGDLITFTMSARASGVALPLHWCRRLSPPQSCLKL